MFFQVIDRCFSLVFCFSLMFTGSLLSCKRIQIGIPRTGLCDQRKAISIPNPDGCRDCRSNQSWKSCWQMWGQESFKGQFEQGHSRVQQDDNNQKAQNRKQPSGVDLQHVSCFILEIISAALCSISEFCYSSFRECWGSEAHQSWWLFYMLTTTSSSMSFQDRVWYQNSDIISCICNRLSIFTLSKKIWRAWGSTHQFYGLRSSTWSADDGFLGSWVHYTSRARPLQGKRALPKDPNNHCWNGDGLLHPCHQWS